MPSAARIKGQPGVDGQDLLRMLRRTGGAVARELAEGAQGGNLPTRTAKRPSANVLKLRRRPVSVTRRPHPVPLYSSGTGHRQWGFPVNLVVQRVEAIPGFIGNTSLSVTPLRPAHPSRVPVARSSTRLGLPCWRAFSWCTCCRTTPAQRLGSSLLNPPVVSASPKGLPGRPAQSTACFAFIRVAACTLALSPIRDMHFRKASTVSLPHSCSGSFRLEHLPGGTCTTGKRRLFAGATPVADFRPSLKLLSSGDCGHSDRSSARFAKLF